MNGNEITLPKIAMRCLCGIPMVTAMFATIILDVSSYSRLKNKNLQNNPTMNEPMINNRIGFHILFNSPRTKCLETSIRSTTISTTCFVIMVPLIFGCLLGIIPYFFVPIITICMNALRMPLIVSLALKRNDTNAFKSRKQRQEWEMKHALEERKRRSEENNPIMETAL